tara:strand:- start:69963 stop:70211 length:249 start_codon:yes stop_codon:yes gene_type:complete
MKQETYEYLKSLHSFGCGTIKYRCGAEFNLEMLAQTGMSNETIHVISDDEGFEKDDTCAIMVYVNEDELKSVLNFLKTLRGE